MKNIQLKSVIFLVTYAIILYFLVLNLSFIFNALHRIFIVLTPFFCGFIIAYLLNGPFSFLKNNVFSCLDNKSDKIKKLKTPLSLFACYILFFGIIVYLLAIIIPQLIVSINQLIKNFHQYIISLEELVSNILSFIGLDASKIEYVESALVNFVQDINQFMTKVFPHIYSFTKSFTSGLYNWIIGIIVSIYFLYNKDTLIKQLKKILVALLPNDLRIRTIEIAKLTDHTFGRYIIGKLLDSLIIGILCFIGMTLFRMPYSVLISVIVGVTNVIPFFGPFIGAIPSIFILLIVDPMKAFWFAIFILILQQIDGNILGPKIIGDSIGISGIWILFSVIIGGGLFGVTGMILGVPIFAIIYSIFSDAITTKIQNDKRHEFVE